MIDMYIIESKMESLPLKVAFLVVLFATITCPSANTPMPSAVVSDVDFDDFSREGIALTIKVTVKNPYPVPVPISNVDYSFKSNTKVVAFGTVSDGGSLKANGITMVDVKVKIPRTALVTLLKDVAADADFDYDVDIKLKVNLPLIGHFTIPVNKGGQMKLLPWRDMYV